MKHKDAVKYLRFILIVILCVLCQSKRHHSEESDCVLVDKRGDNYSNMVTKTKQKYNDKKRCSAVGTGKSRLKILYQNGGNVIHTYSMIEEIETMLDNVRPHVLYMCENRMDDETRSRLTNQHGFSVEELGHGERIWAAVKGTVPYKRKTEYEIPGVCALWLEFGTGASRYIVVGAYREHTRVGVKGARAWTQQRSRWQKLMDQVHKVINDTGVELHLLGDLNLNTMRWSQLGSQKKGWEKQWFVDLLYEKLINGAGMALSDTGGTWTWVNSDGSLKSVLDIHLCNKPAKTSKVTISNEFNKSDHAALIVERAEADVKGDATVTKRKWHEVDEIWLKVFFREFWYWNVCEEIGRLEDPSEGNDRITAILNVMMDSRWPVKTFKIKPNYAPYIKWPLRNLRKQKIRLWKEWKRSGNVETYKEMRKITNKLRSDTRKARKRWFGRKMSDYRDSKGLWKFSKDNSNWKQDQVPSSIIKDGVLLTDPVEVANAINDEIIKKTKDILKDIPDEGIDPLSFTRKFLEGIDVPELNLTAPATHEEVAEAFRQLNITDAAGHDNITTRVVKAMKEELEFIMVHIINKSFEHKKYPTAWKLAKISPLYKKGDKYDAKNYRPVAVLPALSKIMEKVVIGRLKKHMEENGLLSDNQNAYRAKRSVTTAMLQLYDEIVKKQDDGVDSACVFLDCSAAFDTIQHSVLLGKLKLYGVDEDGMEWLKDYLAGRSQYVSIGGTRSDIKRILDGAFQGSIGGPWCFLVMINDITILCKAGSFSVFIYADDTCLRVDLSGDIEKDQEKLDKIVKDIVSYMNSTKLKFNFTKTEFVVTAPKKHDDYKQLVLNFDGQIVKQKLHARLLGLQVSWDLTHKWYVCQMKDNLISSLKKRLYILKKLAPKCPKKCVKNLAHGLIYSKLSFGIQYWSRQLPDVYWRQIEVILNEAARTVLKIRPLQMHTKDVYRILDWLPAKSCRDFQDLSLFWSIKHYRTPRSLSVMFMGHSETLPEDHSRRITRSVTQHSINRTQENDSANTLRGGSYVPTMVRTFNQLEPEYKALPDLRNSAGYPLPDDLKFLDLKMSLRKMVQYRDLGQPEDWPTDRADALLDREEEIFGLGINSSTSEEDDVIDP